MSLYIVHRRYVDAGDCSVFEYLANSSVKVTLGLSRCGLVGSVQNNSL